jgi:vacuolar protein sorting-associated protein 45
METLADMKRFVEEYPEFKKLGGNVAKHVSLVGELSRIIERDGLLGVSELEQSLAANESHAADFKVRPPPSVSMQFLTARGRTS